MRIKRLLATVAATAVIVGGMPTPAHASTTAVDGSGIVTDDFGDHYDELGNSLCYGCADSNGTDLVLMWQAILFAEGYLDRSGIDGYFGPNTDTATKKFQINARLKLVDGKVGKDTWNVTDNRMSWVKVNGAWTVRYHAERGGFVDFRRGRTTSVQADGGYRLVQSRGPNGVQNFKLGPEYGIHLFARTIVLT